MCTNRNCALLISLIAAMCVFIETGCATKNYVKKQIDPVSGRVDALAEVNKQTEAAIKDVDSRAQSGIQGVQSKVSEGDEKATAADRKAVEAQQMARSAETRISTAQSGLDQKIGHIDSYKPVENASINFKSNQAEVGDEAKSTLDQLAAKVKGSKGYMLEVQGFTDSVGSDEYNLVLSQKRSENVVRYLVQQHEIPLFRMFILGLGVAKQVEDNNTKEGRAANRRVEITLLKAEE